MEYVYAALLLDAAKKEISASSLMDVVKAAGMSPDEARAKAVAEALKGVNIEETIKNASVLQAAAPAAAASSAPAAGAKKEEKKSATEEKASEEQAAGGLAGLFG